MIGSVFVLPERSTGPTGEPVTSARVVRVDDVNAAPFWVGVVGTVCVGKDGGVDEDVAHPASQLELAMEPQELAGCLVLGVVVVNFTQGGDIRTLAGGTLAGDRSPTPDVLVTDDVLRSFQGLRNGPGCVGSGRGEEVMGLLRTEGVAGDQKGGAVNRGTTGRTNIGPQ